MNLLSHISVIIFATAPIVSFAEDFHIEDETLTPLPRSVESAIRSSKEFDSHSCKLIGKAVDLSGQGAMSGYVATTASGCDWGSALGPIWVVRIGNPSVVVLSHGGYSLTLGKQSQAGLRHIAISAGSAGWYQQGLWKFSGTKYKNVASYTFTAGDKESCDAHPNICPWKYDR